MKILIIDDDVSATVALKSLLMTKGNFEVDVAYTGRDGLDQMVTAPCDLLVLDVMLPNFSGIEVCRAMNADERLKHIPVVLISVLPINSADFSKMMEDFKVMPFVKGMIEKPFTLDELVMEIEKAMR